MCSRFQYRAIEYVLLCFQILSNIYLPAFTYFSVLSGSVGLTVLPGVYSYVQEG